MKNLLPRGITAVALALALASATLAARSRTRPRAAPPLPPAEPAQALVELAPEPEQVEARPAVEPVDPAPADLAVVSRIAVAAEATRLSGSPAGERAFKHLSASRKLHQVLLERGPCEARQIAAGEQVIERGASDDVVHWVSIEPKSMTIEAGEVRLGAQGELLEVTSHRPPAVEARDEGAAHRCVAARDRCGMTTYCRLDTAGGKLSMFTLPTALPLLGPTRQASLSTPIEGGMLVRFDAPLDGLGAAAAALTYADAGNRHVLVLAQISRAAGEPAPTLLLSSSSRQPSPRVSQFFMSKHPPNPRHRPPPHPMLDLF